MIFIIRDKYSETFKIFDFIRNLLKMRDKFGQKHVNVKQLFPFPKFFEL